MENGKGFYLYGMHPVTEAVRQGRRFEKVLLRKGMEGEQFRTLMEELSAREIPYQFVPSEKLGSIVRGAHQGVIAFLAQIDYVPFEEVFHLFGEDFFELVAVHIAVKAYESRLFTVDRYHHETLDDRFGTHGEHPDRLT